MSHFRDNNLKNIDINTKVFIIIDNNINIDIIYIYY